MPQDVGNRSSGYLAGLLCFRADTELDYSDIAHRLESHESRQEELQKYIKMVRTNDDDDLMTSRHIH